MRRRQLLVLTLAITALALVLTACSSSTPTTGDVAASSVAPGTSVGASGPAVVAVSTPLVGSLVRSIAGDEVEIELLLDPGTDPREAAATPASAIADADLVVLVDPDAYEQGLGDVVDAAESRSIPLVVLAPELAPLRIGGTATDRAAPAEPGAATDPHVWLDTDRWTQAGRLVADAVTGLDGVSAATIDANVEAFDDALARADETIQASVAAGPEGRRTVVSDLHPLAYLTDRYGFELVIPVYVEGFLPTATERGVGHVLTSADGAAALEQLAAVAGGPEVLRVDVEGLGLPVATDPAGATLMYTELVVAAAQAVVTGAGG